ncbi:MAG: hypothetical protein ABIK98_07515, partial [Pseudomonadota bacterium]
IMRQLLDSDLEVFVDSGFIYMPLLFDPAIETELQTLPTFQTSPALSGARGSKTVIKTQGKHFIKTLSLESLVANYERIYPYSFQRLKNACLRKHHLTAEVDSLWEYGTLRTILFEVMPYFIRKNSVLERKKLNEKEILDLVGRKVLIPQRYHQEAKAFLDIDHFRKILEDLDQKRPLVKPLDSGLHPARDLREWFHEALNASIIQRESERLRQTLHLREQFRQINQEHVATLLFIAETGSLEIDDFGFLKGGSHNEYLVYKRTGEYVLKDYYGRSYLFPDCRVAVSTSGPFRPVVIETYKHPFLFRHDPGQEVCLQNFTPPDEFNADNVIRVLEEGITALLYSYDARRRNGYHSLDPTREHIRTIEFVDYRIN